MRAVVSNVREELRASLWFIPGACVLGAIGLSTGVLVLDSRFPELEKVARWLFGGTAESALSLLQTIATAVITVAAVAFSVTIVALQQAAARYTPRVLYTFRRDRRNHVVLGSYIGTFTYALLVMRQVRTADAEGGRFVPALSITIAIVLALVSLALLVYFIHHIVRSLEVSWIVTSIGQELHASLMRLFPETFGTGAGDEALPPDVEDGVGTGDLREAEALAASAGYLRRVDESELIEATRDARFVHVHRRIGEHVVHGMRLAKVWTDGAPSAESVGRIRDAFILGRERSIEQDPLFAVRQLVDIGVKALSPGVNDPATAEEALGQLADGAAFLLEREIPSSLRRADGQPVYLFERPNFADFVEACFGQLRRAARNDLHVTMSILHVLEELLGRAPSEPRRRALRAEVEAIRADVDASGLPDADRKTVRSRASAVLAAAPPARPRQRAA